MSASKLKVSKKNNGSILIKKKLNFFFKKKNKICSKTGKKLMNVANDMRKKRIKRIFIRMDNFSKKLWAIPLKNKNPPTKTNEFSSNIPISKQPLVKLKSD